MANTKKRQQRQGRAARSGHGADRARKSSSCRVAIPAPPMMMTDEQAFIALIDRAARDPNFDSDKFKMLMDARAKEQRRARVSRVLAVHVGGAGEAGAGAPRLREPANPFALRHPTRRSTAPSARPTRRTASRCRSPPRRMSATDIMRVTCRVSAPGRPHRAPPDRHSHRHQRPAGQGRDDRNARRDVGQDLRHARPAHHDLQRRAHR